MTREDALEEMEECEGVEITSMRAFIVNKIYDHFENRSCENCKLQKNKKGYLDCVIAIQVTHRPDFYCSSWIKK